MSNTFYKFHPNLNILVLSKLPSKESLINVIYQNTHYGSSEDIDIHLTNFQQSACTMEDIILY